MITSSRYIKSDHFTMVAKNERYEGIWWIAENPKNKVPGTLHITPEAIWLSLNGIVSKNNNGLFQDLSSYDLILGIQSSGYLFTLEKCVETSNQSPFGNGYSTQNFSVSRVYGGTHVDRVEDLKFSEYFVSYTYLAEWLRNVGLDCPKKVEDGFFIGYDPNKATTIPKLEADLEEVLIEVTSTPLHYFGENFRRSEIKITEIIKVQCKSPMLVKDLSGKILEPLRDFFALATAQPNWVTSLSARDEKGNDINIYTQSPYPAQSIFPLFNKRVILFYASDIANNLTHYLNTWFIIESEMRDVCELFFGVHYDQGAFSTNRLLNIVQALEAYSRVCYGRDECPKEDHQQRVSAILETAPSEYQQWLKNVLSYANHKSLRSRLIELIEQAKPLSNCLIPEPRKFASWVVDTRNYLTHRDRKGKNKIASGDDLDCMIHSLLWLLRIHFLLKVGFDLDQCSELLNKNNIYGSLCSYVEQKAPWRNYPKN